jgi:hypothetical protein
VNWKVFGSFFRDRCGSVTHGVRWREGTRQRLVITLPQIIGGVGGSSRISMLKRFVESQVPLSVEMIKQNVTDVAKLFILNVVNVHSYEFGGAWSSEWAGSWGSANARFGAGA